MANNELNQITEAFEELIKATTRLSFPLISSRAKKESIIVKEKENIDNSFDEILKKYSVLISADFDRRKIWDNAKTIAMGKFTTLPKSCLINSFFLQELMHEYAVKQVQHILKI